MGGCALVCVCVCVCLLYRPWRSLERAWFCVIDDHNTFGRHNPDGNLAPFLRALAPDAWRAPSPGLEVASFGAYAGRWATADGWCEMEWRCLWDAQRRRPWFWHQASKTASFSAPGVTMALLLSGAGRS